VADVEHNVHIFLVFEVAIEADHVLVGERAMDFDFTRELLSRFCSGKVCLGNDFESPSLCLVFFSLNWLELSDFIALGEAPLAKESASQVSDDLALLSGVVRVLEFALFLDDLKKERVMPSVTETRLAFAGELQIIGTDSILTSGQLQLSVRLTLCCCCCCWIACGWAWRCGVCICCFMGEAEDFFAGLEYLFAFFSATTSGVAFSPAAYTLVSFAVGPCIVVV